MTCAWKELLGILPAWMRQAVDRQGKDGLQELRLRINAPPELVFPGKSTWLAGNISVEDLDYIINAASRYSPWAASTAARGFLTVQGGHRIGLCGNAVISNGNMTGLRKLTSLCIRVARDFPGIALEAASLEGSILILGPPGWGKTTLLRDLIRQIGGREPVAVADERGELFPEGMARGCRTDVMTGCPKGEAINMLLRTMGPVAIAVDEITDPGDCEALIQASNCGVRLLASAHGSSPEDLRRRKTYRPLLDNRVFDWVVVLRRDFTYQTERMDQWVTNGWVPS